MKNDNLKNIKSYSYGFIFPNFLKKRWFWFVDPFDVGGVAMVNFFSYNNIDKKGFYKKEGLTSIIDLQQNLDIIWSKMRKKFICKQIKKGERNNIIIKQDNNFKEFTRTYKIFRQAKGIVSDNINIFRKNGILFSAYYKNKMIAGGIFISDGSNIRALVLSSLRQINNSQEKEIVGQANRMLIWEVIKFAKERGHKILDLGGGIVEISKKIKPSTLMEFKTGFGGEIIKCYYYHKVYSRVLRYWMRLRGYKKV